MTTPVAADLRAMRAKVHIARKQIALDEDAYRALLRRVTGQDSLRACSAGEIDRVLRELTRLGFVAAPAKRRSQRAQARMIHAIWADIAPLLEGEAGDAALRAFVRRQTRSAAHPDGIDDPDWLSPAQAKAVIEGLRGWLARLRAIDKAARG